MQLHKVMAIFGCLERYSNHGATLTLVSYEARVEISELKVFFSQYPAFFTKDENDDFYFINGSSSFQGDAGLMLDYWQMVNIKIRKRRILSSAVCMISALIAALASMLPLLAN